MLRHVVMFRFADTVDDAQISALGAALDTLPSKIAVIRSYMHGRDVGLSATNFDYVVVADFDSADDFAVYRDHPDHQAFIERHIVGAVPTRVAVQYLVP
jgi:hypothetical protein